MPFFNWYGVDHSGIITNGILQAHNTADLEQQLQQHSIELLQATPHLRRSRLRSIKARELSFFYRQLNVLLDAGIYLDRALEMVYQQSRHTIFKEIIADIRTTVSQGMPLHSSCAHHHHIFGTMDQGLLQAGQETGQLAFVCLLLAQYHEDKAAIAKKLRAALVIPIITFIVFISSALLIILVLAPTFAQLFASMGQPLPAFTQRMLVIGNFLQSYWFMSLAFALMSGLLLLYRVAKNALKPHVDYALLFFPILGPLVYERDLLFFLQSFSVLIEAKMPMVIALQLALQTVTNYYIRSQLMQAAVAVEQGQSLADALQNMQSLFTPDCLTLITTGQESSNLAMMLKQATKLYSERINRRLMIMSSLVQPLLMIILGILILFLIVSIYLPIFNLSLHVA